MNNQSHDLLSAALTLSESDRAEIAVSLLRSLDPDDDPNADTAWAAEIERRVNSIDDGEAKLVPWNDVKEKMREQNNG